MLTEREVTEALQVIARIGEQVGLDAQETDDELREFGWATAIEELARSMRGNLSE